MAEPLTFVDGPALEDVPFLETLPFVLGSDGKVNLFEMLANEIATCNFAVETLPDGVASP